jgi:hypothetical protein
MGLLLALLLAVTLPAFAESADEAARTLARRLAPSLKGQVVSIDPGHPQVASFESALRGAGVRPSREGPKLILETRTSALGTVLIAHVQLEGRREVAVEPFDPASSPRAYLVASPEFVSDHRFLDTVTLNEKRVVLEPNRVVSIDQGRPAQTWPLNIEISRRAPTGALNIAPQMLVAQVDDWRCELAIVDSSLANSFTCMPARLSGPRPVEAPCLIKPEKIEAEQLPQEVHFRIGSAPPLRLPGTLINMRVEQTDMAASAHALAVIRRSTVDPGRGEIYEAWSLRVTCVP